MASLRSHHLVGRFAEASLHDHSRPDARLHRLRLRRPAEASPLSSADLLLAFIDSVPLVSQRQDSMVSGGQSDGNGEEFQSG